MKLFQSATLRLTGWYMLILTVLCLLFSTIVYSIGTQELHRQPPPGGFGRFNSFDDDVRDAIQSDREARAEATSRRLLANLAVFNVVALGAGGLFAYLLARRTLQPIEQAMESQARFSSDAAHELRTPLSVMQSEIEVTLRGKQPSKTSLQQVLRSNLEEINRLQALTSRLLLLAHTEKIMPQPTQVEDAVTDAVNNVIALAQKKHIRIDTHVAPVQVLADRAVLGDILTIFLDNALKYSPPKAPITILSSQKGKYFILSVTDKGRGIAKQDIPYVFDRFYRADTSRTRDETAGHGLGLALAKRLAETINSNLEVTSQPKKGSTFSISLLLQ